MWNWFKFIIIFIGSVAIAVMAIVFYNASKPYKAIEKEMLQYAYDEEILASIDDISLYNGSESLAVIYGKNEKGADVATFVPVEEKERKPIHTVDLSKGVTAEEAVEAVREEVDLSKVLNVHLGYDEEQVFWEVIFENEEKALNYVYISFESGNWWKRLLNV